MSYMSFNAGAYGVYAPVLGVVVGDVDLAEPRVWVPLPRAFEETMVDGHPDAPLCSQYVLIDHMISAQFKIERHLKVITTK